MTALTTPANLSPLAARRRFLERWKLWGVLLALMAPTIVGTLLFTYYPNFGTVWYSFFKWDYSTTEEFRGLENYSEALTDARFWASFQLVVILFLANLIKMWPSIICAVVLHRLRSERWQYLYRVLFVIPMVIPELIWLLVWKSFYNPTVGALNSVLNATGGMAVLRWADSALPAMSRNWGPARAGTLDVVFGNVWGLAALGLAFLLATEGVRTLGRRWGLWVLLAAFAYWAWGGQNPLYALWLPAAAGAACLIAWRGGQRAPTINRVIGLVLLAVAVAFLLTTQVWTTPTNAFEQGRPAWLSHAKLVVPAVILWGFPWVGTVGVLIYLAGLQNISQDVYEAAELDGVGSLGKFFRIELPLILTQVRINLIFMTIGTLTGYGLFYILLGQDGGPESRGMVPGLYMFREGFVNQRFGYACALGMLLFVLVLSITILYQKYVRVEK